jgi:hypothetical protein
MDMWNFVNATSRSPSVSSHEVNLDFDGDSIEGEIQMNISKTDKTTVTDDDDTSLTLDEEIEDTKGVKSITIERVPKPKNISVNKTTQLLEETSTYFEKGGVLDKHNVDEEVLPLYKSPRNKNQRKKTGMLNYFENLTGIKIKRSGLLLLGITAMLIISSRYSSS